MPFDPEIGGGNFVPGAWRRPEPLVDRDRLMGEFRSRFPDVEGDLGAHLQERLGRIASRYSNYEYGSDELNGYIEKFRPVWNNEAQRQAIMAIAERDGNMDQLSKMFPDYVPEDIADHQARHLLPPGVRSILDAQRDLDYYNKLSDPDYTLKTADVAIGNRGETNLLRDDLTNWFDHPAEEGRSGALTPFGGPNYPQAQESPAAIGVVANPRAPLTTGMLGVMGAVPSLTQHSVSAGSLAPVRAAGGLLDNLRYDSLQEMPTAEVSPLYRGRPDAFVAQEAAKDATAARETMAATQPDAGQAFLQDVGMPDSLNTPGAGLAADAVVGFMDHNSPSTIRALTKMFGRSLPQEVKQAARGAVYSDARNETAQGLGEAGLIGLEDNKPTNTRLERDESRGEAIRDLRKRVPISYVQDSVRDTNPVFQRMIATNPHLQQDRMNLARENYERDLAAQAANAQGSPAEESIRRSPASFMGKYAGQ